MFMCSVYKCRLSSKNYLYIKPTVSLFIKNEISFILKYSNGSPICKFEKTCVVLESLTQEIPKTGHKILPDAALSLK